MPPIGDISKGDDDALDPALLGAIRQYPPGIPGTTLSFDLPLDGRESSQHRPCIGQKSDIGCQRIEIRKRPTDVARYDIEERPGCRREEADIEVGIKEQCRDI